MVSYINSSAEFGIAGGYGICRIFDVIILMFSTKFNTCLSRNCRNWQCSSAICSALFWRGFKWSGGGEIAIYHLGNPMKPVANNQSKSSPTVTPSLTKRGTHVDEFHVQTRENDVTEKITVIKTLVSNALPSLSVPSCTSV